MNTETPFFLPDPDIARNRQLIAYGAGLCLLQMQAIGYKFLYAVDDTPGVAGKTSGGVPIFSNDRLRKLEPDQLIVICASKPPSILAMASRLNSLGLTWGVDYIDCTVLQFPSALSRLKGELSITGSKERFAFVRLLSFYAAINNLSCATGTWLLTELLEQRGQESAGAIAECGVYFGGNAFVTLMASDVARKKRYYLLDSFEGFEEKAEPDPVSRMGDFKGLSLQRRMGDFKGANLGRLKDMFRNFEEVRICKGYFHETVPAIRGEQFSLVYVDCDLYEPTKFLCEQLYDRVATGGFLVFHDYWFPETDPPHLETFKGVKKALQEFLGSEISRVVEFPETTHGVLVKT